MSSSLARRLNYGQRYFDSDEKLLSQIVAKTVVPYQVEVQPGRIGGAICWLKCPYCYGGSSANTAERLTPARYVDLMRQMLLGPHGRVDKIIYGGYATDPLNYQNIDDLVEVSIEGRQVVGFHSKLIKISDRLIDLLTHDRLRETSYFTISVDAGSAAAYNAVHALQPTAKVYERVIANIRRLTDARSARSAPLDITANYLITTANCATAEIAAGIDTLLDAGVSIVRFSLPQVPRGQEDDDKTGLIPSAGAIARIRSELEAIIAPYGEQAMITADPAENASGRRTLPCFARFIYPAISYDGFLSNCSQSAAPHFRNMALGDLSEVDFWDAFYSYDADDLRRFMDRQHDKMIMNDCRCDRKEHRVNRQLQSLFDAMS